MKQVVEDPGSGEVRVLDVPAPGPRAGGCLVRTLASVVSSGTERAAIEFGRKSIVGKAVARPDLVARVTEKARTDGIVAAYRAARSRLDEPLPLGYSSAGVVVDDGGTGIGRGALVACAAAPHAEVTWVSRTMLAPAPAGVSPETAAFATIASVALHGVHRARVRGGERVGIVGLGLIGRLALQILKAYGCSTLGVDVSPRALDAGRALGADAVAPPDGAEAASVSVTGGEGLDAVLVCAAAKDGAPLELAARLCRLGGTVCVVGDVPIEASRRLFYERELDLVVSRSYGFGRHDAAYETGGADYPIEHARWTIGRNLEEALRLMGAGRLRTDGLVGARYRVDRAPEAYAALVAGTVGGGVVLEYGADGTVEAARTVAIPDGAPAAVAGAPGIAVVGAGAFARSTLLPALADAGPWRKVAVASRGGLSARECAKRFGFAHATTDVDRVLADPSVDLVVVATRHDAHARLAAAALRHGKDVFVEKPLAIDEDGLREVARAAQESRRRLHVGFNRRFAPFVERVVDAFSGDAAPVSIDISVNAGPLPQDHWLRDAHEGGGRILGEACHFVDLAQHLARSPPAEVSAVAGGGPGGPDDHFTATMRFENGSTATIRYTGFGPRGFPKERVEVVGADRAAVIDNFRALTLVEGRRSRTTRAFSQDKGHRAGLAALRRAIAQGAPSPTPLDGLVASTLATLAVRTSLAEGRRIRVHPPVVLGKAEGPAP